MSNNAVVPAQKPHDSPSSSKPLPQPSPIRPFTHPSIQSFPIVPTPTGPQPHIEQLILPNEYHQKQQEQLTQLKLQLVQSQQRQEQLGLQLLQMEQQRQLLTYHQQLQQHPLAPQDIPLFQHPAPLDNDRWGLIQPCWSMNSPSAIHSQCNQGQSYPAYWLPTSQDFKTATFDRNRDETRRHDDAKGTQRRLSGKEKAKIREYRKNHPHKPYSKIAKLFGCSKSTVHRIVNLEVVAGTSR
ncbi:MAG: hypothetical protein J3Q66DRAFT_427721 [Benniella sp.]|nr:MAG: hypothetical protein J3Q66DRAFT_427721 [Benniella sp.]